jgi:hypothetical protein
VAEEGGLAALELAAAGGGFPFAGLVLVFFLILVVVGGWRVGGEDRLALRGVCEEGYGAAGGVEEGGDALEREG